MSVLWEAYRQRSSSLPDCLEAQAAGTAIAEATTSTFLARHTQRHTALKRRIHMQPGPEVVTNHARSRRTNTTLPFPPVPVAAAAPVGQVARRLLRPNNGQPARLLCKTAHLRNASQRRRATGTLDPRLTAGKRKKLG
ncbi:hypothetical protein DIPPA_15037 [Diplonema papillatum]|nr:hypothetical protein DIPPA_15037 [Diplonema papillatum]